MRAVNAMLIVPVALSGRGLLLWRARDKTLLQRHLDAGREWGVEMVIVEGSIEALAGVGERLTTSKAGTLLIEADLVYPLKMLRRLQLARGSVMLVDESTRDALGMARLSNADSRRLATILHHRVECGGGAAPYSAAVELLDRRGAISRLITSLRWTRFGSPAELAAADETVRRVDLEDTLWNVREDGPR